MDGSVKSVVFNENEVGHLLTAIEMVSLLLIDNFFQNSIFLSSSKILLVPRKCFNFWFRVFKLFKFLEWFRTKDICFKSEMFLGF